MSTSGVYEQDFVFQGETGALALVCSAFSSISVETVRLCSALSSLHCNAGKRRLLSWKLDSGSLSPGCALELCHCLYPLLSFCFALLHNDTNSKSRQRLFLKCLSSKVLSSTCADLFHVLLMRVVPWKPAPACTQGLDQVLNQMCFRSDKDKYNVPFFFTVKITEDLKKLAIA